ncbi:MAG: DMT family transporter [Ottowia sp.]|nr:DMT family transporter [Ottowia sp.]
MAARPGLSPALRGVALVLAGAMLWGTTGTAQTFVAASLSPFWVGTLRVAIATLFFAIYVAFTTGWSQAGADLLAMDARVAVPAGIAMAGYNLFFFAGVKTVGVAVGTALVLGSSPLWAGLLQALVGVWPQRQWWLGTGIAIMGGILLVLGRGGPLHADALGIAFCLGAGFSYAAYTVLNKQLVVRWHPATVTFYVFLVASLIAVPAAWLLVGPLRLSGRGWGVVLFLGVVATGVAYLLYSDGLRFVSAASAVSLALMESATAFVLALVVVGERPLLAAYAGFVILLAGLALVVRAETRFQPGTARALDVLP